MHLKKYAFYLPEDGLTECKLNFSLICKSWRVGEFSGLICVISHIDVTVFSIKETAVTC